MRFLQLIALTASIAISLPNDAPAQSKKLTRSGRTSSLSADTSSARAPIETTPSKLPRSGPFGIWHGEPIADIQRMGATADAGHPGWFTIIHPPKPHEAFESYYVLALPAYGVCKIDAIGVDVPTNTFGSAITERFESIERAISSKYGQGKKFDFVRSGSIWNEPNDFMMGLYKQDRTLASFWDAEQPGMDTLKTDGVTSIYLNAKALSLDKAYLTLHYEFANSAQCMDELKAKKNEVF